jgi:carboxyl-terminal processing protease
VAFDQVWNQIQAQYFDYDRLATAWEDARLELRPRAAAITDIAALRTLLVELLSRIGESHFEIIPAEVMTDLNALPGSEAPELAQSGATGPSSTGMRVRFVQDQLRVTWIDPEGSAWQAGIRPGWELLAVDDYDVDQLQAGWPNTSAKSAEELRRARLLLEIRLHSLLSYPDQDRSLGLVFRDTNRQIHEIFLTGQALNLEPVRIGDLPPMSFEWRLSKSHHDSRCISKLRFSAWVPALSEVIRQQRHELLQCDGLIIDLRGNLGGVVSTMIPLAAEVFDQPTVLGKLLRSDGQIDFRVLPRRVDMDGRRVTPYAGPIAILTDSLSASTSEMFASGMQASGRARVFGEQSAGMALPAVMLPLESGDFLMYAFADYRDSAGRRIEGVGVQPDVAVAPTDSDASGVLDPPMEHAIDWILKEQQALVYPTDDLHKAGD